jgi:hypothetical protein
MKRRFRWFPLPTRGERVRVRRPVGYAQNRGDATFARRALIALAATAVLARPFAGHAQLAPNRPIRIIVPFAPAGSSDVLARLL